MRYLALFVVLLSLQSCIYGEDDEVTYESAYEPITQTRELFENGIEVQSSRPISSAGKIYVKDQYILINESEDGFHLYNNLNPESPEVSSYLKVEGATDLAIRGNTIFVHHLVDLVSINYDFQNNTILSMNRSRNVFPKLTSPDGFRADFFNVEEDQIIVGYQLKN